MQYGSAIECALLFLFSLLLLSVPASPLNVFDKRQDLSAFTSAINGAGRLRYGKRAQPFAFPIYSDDELNGAEQEWTSNDMLKRSPVASKLIQSLNGVDRLRFGRK
ncbi:hypothetical protein WR25_14090 [Diploscapter pachys]|uniref:Uncharacterized protein n=1 Tax=Diploscapter pachys TaxID=2018661 RepID=A0A2A2K853_9BILA|nr:hypothetical protein WR25_14090 [Diploscapter pachys]